MNQPRNFLDDELTQKELLRTKSKMSLNLLASNASKEDIEIRKKTLEDFGKSIIELTKELLKTTVKKKEQKTIEETMFKMLANLTRLHNTFNVNIDDTTILMIFLNFIEQEILEKFKKFLKRPNFLKIIESFITQQLLIMQTQGKITDKNFIKYDAERTDNHRILMLFIVSAINEDLVEIKKSIDENIDINSLTIMLKQIEWTYYNLIPTSETKRDYRGELDTSMRIINKYYAHILSPRQKDQKEIQIILKILDAINKKVLIPNPIATEAPNDNLITDQTDLLIKTLLEEPRLTDESTNIEPAEAINPPEMKYYSPIIAEIEKQSSLICERLDELETEIENATTHISNKKRELLQIEEKYSQLLKEQVLNPDEIWNIQDTVNNLQEQLEKKKSEKEERKLKLIEEIQGLEDFIDNENTKKLDEITKEIKSLEYNYNYCISLQKLRQERTELSNETTGLEEIRNNLKLEYIRLEQILSNLLAVEESLNNA